MAVTVFLLEEEEMLKDVGVIATSKPKGTSFLCSPARLERDFDFASLATAGHVDTVSVTLILVNDGRRMLARFFCVCVNFLGLRLLWS